MLFVIGNSILIQPVSNRFKGIGFIHAFLDPVRKLVHITMVIKILHLFG